MIKVLFYLFYYNHLKMKLSKLLYLINLGIVIFLGSGWFFFYWFTLTTDLSNMLHAMTMNYTIAGLNLTFAISLILLPISFKKRN